MVRGTRIHYCYAPYAYQNAGLRRAHESGASVRVHIAINTRDYDYGYYYVTGEHVHHVSGMEIKRWELARCREAAPTDADEGGEDEGVGSERKRSRSCAEDAECPSSGSQVSQAFIGDAVVAATQRVVLCGLGDGVSEDRPAGHLAVHVDVVEEGGGDTAVGWSGQSQTYLRSPRPVPMPMPIPMRGAPCVASSRLPPPPSGGEVR